MKDYWRHEDRDAEGELYSHIYGDREELPGIAKMYSHGTVIIEGWERREDTTMNIRGELEPAGPSRRFYNRQPTVQLQEKLMAEPLPVDARDYLPEENGYKPPQPRVHTRLVLSTYGWSIKHFVTLLELVYTLSAIVTGQWVIGTTPCIALTIFDI